MTEPRVLHLVSKQPLAECCDGWESLWASTTCSLSHILSHLRGTDLIRSSTQLLHDTFNCHQMLHSRGAREPRRARLLPWPLSFSRFPRMEKDTESFVIGCCGISTNRGAANNKNNHRYCCYVTEPLEYAHLWILAGPAGSVGTMSRKSVWRQIAASLYELHIRKKKIN